MTNIRAFLTIPSARPYAEIAQRLASWKAQGYGIALWRDHPGAIPEAGMLVTGKYPGYSRACNHLIRTIFTEHPEVRFCVIGGDDTDPDYNYSANEITAQLEDHFNRHRTPSVPATLVRDWATLGVMQPTGDRFAGGQIDRIAGSAWIGREWARLMYNGAGPLWYEYSHMFCDEELQRCAMATDTFLQRRDLIHLHHHYTRQCPAIDSNAVGMPIPAHLIEVAKREHWNQSQALFRRRERAGWPGLRRW